MVFRNVIISICFILCIAISVSVYAKNLTGQAIAERRFSDSVTSEDSLLATYLGNKKFINKNRGTTEQEKCNFRDELFKMQIDSSYDLDPDKMELSDFGTFLHLNIR